MNVDDKFNQTQELLLGETDLRKYIQPIVQENSDMQKTLDKLKSDGLESEKYFVRELENKVISTKYKQIDLSFMEMDSEFNTQKNKIMLPKFTAYEFYGSNNYAIEFSKRNRGPGTDSKKLYISFQEFEGELELTKYWEKLLTNLGVKNFPNKDHRSITVLLNDKYNPQIDGTFKFSTQFIGLIPTEVKENVKQAQNYFDKKNIYLITETKPEEWNVEHITKDPLVVGMKNKRAYLIDHFDTTELEDLVKDTHTNLS